MFHIARSRSQNAGQSLRFTHGQRTELEVHTLAEKLPGVCIIGAGMCGNAAALKLVREGIPVTLIDRGSPIGSKNISGGILWGRELEEVLPRFWEEMPYERPITSKRISFLTDKSGFTLEFKNTEWRQPPHAGFAILRARVDKWLAEKVKQIAEETGAVGAKGSAKAALEDKAPEVKAITVKRTVVHPPPRVEE